MSAPTSVYTPLMERGVCAVCEHFHSHCITDKCACCKSDAQAGEPT